MAQALVVLIRIVFYTRLYVIVYLQFCYFSVKQKRRLVEESSTQLFSILQQFQMTIKVHNSKSIVCIIGIKILKQ